MQEQFDMVFKPLLQAKIEKEIKEKEQMLLSDNLSRITTIGTNAELEDSINRL